MRKLDIELGAMKWLDGLPAKHFRQVVSAVFDLLREPLPHYSKPLSGTAYLRLKLGEYRVVYRYDADTIYVLVIGKRNDDEIYRLLNRKA